MKCLSSILILTILCNFLQAENQKGKYGFIDREGKISLECVWDDAESFTEGLAPVKQNGKWGYIDKKGKLVIPCQFDQAFEFKHGLAEVKNATRSGMIDRHGKLIVPCKYDSVHFRYYEPPFHINTEINEVYQNYTREGKLLRKNNDVEIITSQGTSLFRDTKSKKTFYLAKGDKILDPSSKLVQFPDICTTEKSLYGDLSEYKKIYLPLGYRHIRAFENDTVAIAKNDQHFLLTADEKLTLIPQGHVMSEYCSDHLGLIKVRNIHSKEIGFVNRLGELKIPYQWDCAEDFHTPNHTTAMKDGKFCLLHESGKPVGGIEWDCPPYICPEYKLAIVQKNKKFGVINFKGDRIIPCIWDSLDFNHEEASPVTLACEKSNKFGLLNLKGEILHPAIYDALEYSSDNVYFTKKGNKHGAVSTTKLLVEPIYQSLDHLGQHLFIGYINKTTFRIHEGLTTKNKNLKYQGDFERGDFAPICIGDKDGLVHKTGKVVQPAIWDEITPIEDRWRGNSSGYFHVPESSICGHLVQTYSDPSEKMGYINHKGKLVIPVKYYDLDFPLLSDIARVQLQEDGLYGYIDQFGKTVTDLKWQDAGDFNEGLAPVQLAE